ncbi:MAG: tetratricopeptide repeat protein [Leptospiraceae bacterium]|nr:tetratricopeptide repeat protein [Leptospiraceae bacterium]MCP5495584.1 tetratricopeptide repeat protein [Leptospiraceae bacterium]
MYRLFLFLIILLSFFYNKKLFSVPYYTSYCHYIDSDQKERTVINDFLLSLAIRKQTRALHFRYDKMINTYRLHSDALKYFQLYIECNKKNNIPINGFTYYLKSISHFEVNENEISLKELDKALFLDPRIRNAYLLKSRILIRQQKLIEASDSLESIIPIFSEDSDILFLLGTINAEIGRYHKSILYLSSLLNLISNKGGERRYKIHILKYLGKIYSEIDIDKSLYYYKAYLKIQPKDINTHFTVINLYNNKGDLKSAKAQLNKIEKIEPKSSKIKLIRAEIYYIQKKKNILSYFQKIEKEGLIKKNSLIEGLYLVLQDKYPEAERIILAYRKKYPKKVSPRLAYIEILKKTGKFQGLSVELKDTAELLSLYRQYYMAIELAKELLKLSEKNSDIKIKSSSLYNFTASCYEKLSYPYMALHYIRLAIKASSNNSDRHSYMLHYANILRLPPIKRYDKSNRVIKRILKKDKKNTNSYVLLGLNYMAMEKYNKSIDVFSKAIAYNDMVSNFYFYRANAFEKLGNIENTIRDLKKAVELDSQNADAHNYLGYLYTEKGIDLQEAFNLIKVAVELEPDNGAFQDSMGWIYYKMGKIEEAKHHINLALQLMMEKKEEDPVIYEHLGDIFYKMNDTINANENWKKSLEINKDISEKRRIKLKLQNLSQK